MKILSLELLRWGPFSDLALDFSSPARAFHLVVGSNEAGKSTTLRAVGGLLFGIPERTSDDHRHKMSELRISGRIGYEDGSELAIVRRKGRKETLLDPAGQPLDEALLRKLLGSIERAQFETMFGLSHDGLVKGGRELVEGQGDLGESLFGAGLGQTVASLLRKLGGRADEIYLPRGKKRKLNDAIDKFKEAKKRAQELSQSARDFEDINKQLGDRRAETSRIAAELVDLGRRMRRLQRVKQALRPLAERAEVLAALDVRRDVVVLPETAAEDRRRTQAIIHEAGPREEKLREDVRELEGKLAVLAVPTALLQKGALVRQVQGELGSHKKASIDATRLRGELRQVEDEARGLCARLGRRDISVEEAEAWRLSAVASTRVRSLVKQKVELDAAAKSAESAFGAAEERLDDEKRRGAALPPPADVEALAHGLDVARREGDLDKRIQERARAAESLGQRVQAGRAALSLFDVPFDKIGNLPMPARETIERFERGLGVKDEELRSLGQTLADRKRKLSALERELEQIRRGGAVPTEADWASARSGRDAAWIELRRALLPAEHAHGADDIAAFRSAPPRPGVEAVFAYEASVRHADDLAASLFREADRVAKVSQRSLEQQGLLREIAELDAERQSLEAARDELGRQWQEQWKASSLVPLSPAEMKGFLGQYERLVEDRRRWAEAEALLAADRALAADHEETLGALLRPLGLAVKGLPALMERARAVCEREAKAQKDREAHERDLGRAKDQVAQCKALLERRRAEHAAWSAQWAEAMAGVDLPEATGTVEAEEVLALRSDLEKRCADARDRRRRIEGIERDARLFADRVVEITRAAATDLVDAPIEHAANLVVERFLAAEKDEIARQKDAQKLDEKRRELEDVILRRKAAENELTALQSAARAESLAELGEAEDRSKEVRALKARLAPIERQLLDLGEGLGIEALVAECQGLSGDDVATELSSLDEQIQAKNDAKAKVEQEIGKLEERRGRVDGGDGAAQAAAEAEGHLASMGVLVEEYARARLAFRLLEDEIKHYRERHQGPIVRRASELFQRLTLGSFLEIRGDDEGDESRPVLKCVRTSGERVGVEGLSDGTRDQLFFALRMASLERHFEHNEPIPFVLDDILVNFDDARSRAALSILGDLSQKTQVLFFTHHARVADLAREAVPPSRLCLHDLDTLGGRARLRPAS
ncbi:AAA family ATPase [Polyangium sorediatum]|uniref:AAA family ATPase n=1 Tax=Polyangium sorediatum TaxID=889274 RepID=A0ABT6NN74_9BACT|nr:YhaN family protein [Polyangium sorediatum]MDI1429776.1 AAA family ATPase [Polyangium sorediatum]